MVAVVRVTEVEHLDDRVLRVVFSDGLVRELDFSGLLTGVLATIDDDITFAAATVDRVEGTVCWPGGIDLDPDVLHGDHAAATASGPRVVRQYQLQESS